MFRRVIFGPLNRPENQKLKDIGVREIVMLAPILVLIFFMGIYPQPFLSRMKPSIELIIQRVESKKEATPLILEGAKSRETKPYGN